MTETEFKQAIMNAYNVGYRDAELDCTGCESSRDISEFENADIYYEMTYHEQKV
tara:strand:+ start:1504 stop:1665 length:162 start_codon:yes stop_codon:yes gene_type:complete